MQRLQGTEKSNFAKLLQRNGLTQQIGDIQLDVHVPRNNLIGIFMPTGEIQNKIKSDLSFLYQYTDDKMNIISSATLIK